MQNEANTTEENEPIYHGLTLPIIRQMAELAFARCGEAVQTLIYYTELLLSGYQIWSAEGQRVIMVNEQTGDVETLIFPVLQ